MPPPTAPGLLRKWRESQGLTQAEAGKKLRVHQNTWSDWEGGRKVPRTGFVLAIQAMTGGDVPASAWLTRAELALVAQLEKAA